MDTRFVNVRDFYIVTAKHCLLRRGKLLYAQSTLIYKRDTNKVFCIAKDLVPLGKVLSQSGYLRVVVWTYIK